MSYSPTGGCFCCRRLEGDDGPRAPFCRRPSRAGRSCPGAPAAWGIRGGLPRRARIGFDTRRAGRRVGIEVLDERAVAHANLPLLEDGGHRHKMENLLEAPLLKSLAMVRTVYVVVTRPARLRGLVLNSVDSASWR